MTPPSGMCETIYKQCVVSFLSTFNIVDLQINVMDPDFIE